MFSFRLTKHGDVESRESFVWRVNCCDVHLSPIRVDLVVESVIERFLFFICILGLRVKCTEQIEHKNRDLNTYIHLVNVIFKKRLEINFSRSNIKIFWF